MEKNFNGLLEDYRMEVLPMLTKNWETMTVEEQNSIGTLNNFFCGLHLLVGLAETTFSTLLQWEITHFKEAVGAATFLHFTQKSNESGIIRLIRTACKALSKHGSEQSGVFQPFTSYLKLNGVKRNPLATFKGNRFNIIFYDAGALFYIADLVKSFFCDAW